MNSFLNYFLWAMVILAACGGVVIFMLPREQDAPGEDEYHC